MLIAAPLAWLVPKFFANFCAKILTKEKMYTNKLGILSISIILGLVCYFVTAFVIAILGFGWIIIFDANVTAGIDKLMPQVMALPIFSFFIFVVTCYREIRKLSSPSKVVQG